MYTPPAGSSGNTPPQGSQPPASGKPIAGQIDPSDPWYQYAQQMFPNQEITPEIIAGLKRNMMTMINTTISQINARHAQAQKYNKEVAQGG